MSKYEAVLFVGDNQASLSRFFESRRIFGLTCSPKSNIYMSSGILGFFMISLIFFCQCLAV